MSPDADKYDGIDGWSFFPFYSMTLASPKAKVRHDSATHSGQDEDGRRTHSSSVSRSESQHKDERNFRSHYLGKVGLLGVDEKKTLELLLNEDPVSISKCAQFAIKCPVPSARRLHLWKVILGKIGLVFSSLWRNWIILFGRNHG